MSRQSTWTNSDGLVVGFGTHSKDNDVAAVVSERGSVKQLVMEINGTSVPASWAAANVQPQAPTIPRGSRIISAVFETVVAFTSGGAATLSVGTYGGTAYTTTDVAAGLISAAALTAIDAIGETVVGAGTLVNATIPVGATADTDVVIGYNYGTAAFTAGKGILTVSYVEPALGNTIAA